MTIVLLIVTSIALVLSAMNLTVNLLEHLHDRKPAQTDYTSFERDPETVRAETLKARQWDNLMNYNGEKQSGGDE